MKKTNDICCLYVLAMATAVSTFGVRQLVPTYPVIDKNGDTVPVERDV